MSITDISPIIYPIVRTNAGSSATLDSAEEFLAVVIKIPKSGTLNKIGWRTGTITAGTSYTLRISIETVAEVLAQPVSTTDAAKTLYAANATSDITSGLESSAVYYTPINGANGISVNAGDLVAITFRLVAANGASIQVRYGGSASGGDLSKNVSGAIYSATYLGGSWSIAGYTPIISLQYSDGFVPTLFTTPPSSQNNITYSSALYPKYAGVKFQYPVNCRLAGCSINIDLDGDVDVYLYNSDGYSVFSGFPIRVKSTQRTSTSVRDIDIVFPQKPELLANTAYRLIIAPVTSSTVVLYNYSFPDDVSYYGVDQFFEGNKFLLTQRNSAPTSEDHEWTDSTTDKPAMIVIIDGIETGSSGSGISRSRQLMG